MAARFFQQLCVFGDFTAEQRAQTGHDIAGQATAAHDHTEDLPFDFLDLVADDIFCCDD